MNKYSFLDDYSEGCHPNILNTLTDTNRGQQLGYGEDEYSQQARVVLRELLDDDRPGIHFVAGGTLANIITISSCLRPHEAVISANTGHIVLRETGAIEATGHKIITAPSNNGKLTPEDIKTTLNSNAHYPHMAKPRLVYISNATELGTLYTKAELKALSSTCKQEDLLLFLDGARLGAALSAEKSDLTLKDIAKLTDLFWIGGTKAGALLGEAIVIGNEALAEDFSFHVKQRGALLAKGRLLGIQFHELFKSGLFFSLTKRANGLAKQLSTGIISAGYELAAETETNQIFPILPNPVIEQLKDEFEFYIWEKIDSTHSVIRLVTSWATDEKQVDTFLSKVMSANL